uniref:hypothetical protein n=1 Tax=Salmonella sp. s55044 TaxID=3159677 RepID=UPI00397EC111
MSTTLVTVDIFNILINILLLFCMTTRKSRLHHLFIAKSRMKVFKRSESTTFWVATVNKYLTCGGVYFVLVWQLKTLVKTFEKTEFSIK